MRVIPRRWLCNRGQCETGDGAQAMGSGGSPVPLCTPRAAATCHAGAVAYDTSDTFMFGYRAVADRAPNMSGVYTIHTSRRWLYVGESDDIKQSLFAHLNAPSGCLEGRGPLSFSFEASAPEHRVDRQRALVAALSPACNPHQPGR
jgi:hypothetical protein